VKLRAPVDARRFAEALEVAPAGTPARLAAKLRKSPL
jgi:hypothetical protein